jgi:DNA-binding SARP family transcriptional activator
MPVADLRIELLGGFRVTVGARAISDAAWRRRKPAGVLKLLALAAGHRLHREQVLDHLWPDLDPAAASANLRKALHHARRALDPEGGALLITSDGEHLCLPRDRVRVDVDEFLAAIARARRARDPETYALAIELYGGGLLPEDPYDDWLAGRRDDLRLQLLAALEELVGVLEARGDLEAAAHAVRRLIAAEPLREDAHARLIRLLALAGRRAEALRAYEHLRGLLAAELGAEPSPSTQRLYEEIRVNQAAQPELTAALWERIGDLRLLSGDTGGAASAFDAALGLGVPPEARVRLHRKSAMASLMAHRAGEAEPHLGAAEREVSDPAERGRLACLRAHQSRLLGDHAAAGEHAEVALELARGHGDADDLAAAREALAVVAHMRGDWLKGLELEIERTHAEEAGTAQLARVYDVHSCIGQFHLYGDRLQDSVEEYARRTLALAEGAGAARAQAFAWCLLGEALLLRARWEEAAGCLQRSCELHEALGNPTAGLPWARLAELAVCLGRRDEAVRHLDRAAAIATVSPMARHLWGRIHATTALAALERGDPATAARSVRAAAGAAARYGDCQTCGALLNPVAAEAFGALGDRAEAQEYAAAASAVATLFESSAWRAMAESAEASAAAAAGKPSLARERYETAAGLYARARHPYWEERARRLAASV